MAIWSQFNICTCAMESEIHAQIGTVSLQLVENYHFISGCVRQEIIKTDSYIHVKKYFKEDNEVM